MARKNLKNVQQIKITLEHGVPMASSLQVAKHFGKAHDNVLRDIRELLEKAPKDWASLSFEDIEASVLLPHSGGFRKDPAYMMTRDGFTMLAMREVKDNFRALKDLRRLLTPASGLDSATEQKWTVSLVRGQLIK